VRWSPLAGPNEEDEGKPVPDIDGEDDMLGKPWTYVPLPLPDTAFSL